MRVYRIRNKTTKDTTFVLADSVMGASFLVSWPRADCYIVAVRPRSLPASQTLEQTLAQIQHP